MAKTKEIISDPNCPDAIIFCDHIVKEHGTGKLSMIGTFQQLNAPGFPFHTPRFYVVCYLTNIEGEFENLSITLRLEDEESEQVLFSATGQLGLIRKMEKDNVTEIPFPIDSTILPEAGHFSFVALVNNEIFGKRKLPVQSITTTYPEIKTSDEN